MTILVPSLTVLIPILTLPFWLFYFDITPKVVALLAGAAAGLVLLPWRIPSIRALLAAPEGRGLFLLAVFQGGAWIVSTVWSTNPALSATGSNWRMYGLVTQLALLLFIVPAAAAIAQDRRLIPLILRAIALSGSCIAVYSIFQYFGWDPLLPSAAYHIGEGEWTIVRPPGTIGHADYLGSYLVFAVFLGGSLIWNESRKTWRAVGLLAMLSGAIGIVLSGTRSAMLALAFGTVLLLIRIKPGWKTLSAATVLFVVVFTAFYYSPMGLKMRGRVRWFREDPTGGARILLWRDSLRMAAGRPLIGWGAETYSTEFPKYQSQELARAYPDFYHESPHNIFLDEFAASGIGGALPFCLWCLFVGRAAWRALDRRADLLVGVAFFAGLVSLQFNAFVLTTAFFFYLVSVMLMAADSASPPAHIVDRKWSWPLGIAAVASALLLSIVAVRVLATDVLMARVRTQLERGDVTAAATTHESVRRWNPRPGSSDLYYSRNMAALVRRQEHILLSVKAWQEAVQAGIRATHSAEDRHNAFYHLASLYAQVNNRKDAEKSLRGAIASAPNWFKPHWMLAQVLQAGGRNVEARAEAEIAVRLDGGKHSEVSETLRQLRGR